MVAAVSDPQRDAHFRGTGGERGKGALRVAKVATAGLLAGDDLSEPQVQAAEFRLCLVIQLGCIHRTLGLVGDQRGVQRVDATESRGLDERTQSGQRGVCAVVTLLCPGDQQRLQQLGEALARKRTEALFRRLPMAGAHLDLTQQQLRRLAVRQLAGELHRLGTAGDQAGDKRLLLQFWIIRAGGYRMQELGGRGLRIRLGHREATGEEFTVDLGRRVAARASGSSPVGEGSAAAQADNSVRARRSARRARRTCCICSVYVRRP